MTYLWGKPSDEERLFTSLKNLPDEELLHALKKGRSKGRNDYPITPMWRTLLMSFTHSFPSIEQMRRTSSPSPPPSHAFSRFVSRLLEQMPLLETMQHSLISKQYKENPQFGGILSFGEILLETPLRKESGNTLTRRSTEGADNGEKITYDLKHKNHRLIQWHGYRLHYILDTRSTLPIISRVIPASVPSHKAILSLLKEVKESHPSLLNACNYALGDTTYDEETLINTLWSTFDIKPIFELLPSNTCALLTSLSPEKNACYNDSGEVFCTQPRTREKHPMTFAGFEKGRSTLKYRCYAFNYGGTCKGDKQCTAKRGIRIPLSINRRLFTPVARSSYKWQTLISELTTKESYETYLKATFIPKLPYTRGLDKLRLYNILSDLLLLSSK